MPETSQSDLYGEEYYRTGCTRGDGPPYRKGEPIWEGFFGGVADEIVRSLEPKTVFDAGCAIGFLVEALWDRGVTAHGRDISEYAIGQVRPDVKQYCEVGSVTEPIEGRYDLITCIEILEHIPESDGIAAIAKLTEASDQVLFSSSPDDFDEPTHVNVRPPIYWSRLFAERSFAPALRYDASFIAPHAVLFVRTDEAPPDELLMGHAELIRTRLELSSAREGKLRAEQAKLQAEQAKVQAEQLLAETSQRLQAELDGAQAALREAHEGFESERGQSALELQAAQERAAEAEQAMDAVTSSTSWRLTAPVRSVTAVLRKALRPSSRAQ